MAERNRLACFVPAAPLPCLGKPDESPRRPARPPQRRARCCARATPGPPSSHLGRRAVVLAGGALLAGIVSGTESSALADSATDAEEVVIDAGRLLSRGTSARLAALSASIEKSSGLQLRVVTLGAGLSGNENLRRQLERSSDRKVVLVADDRGGNLLTVQVGDLVYGILPRSFWIELPNRFGNQFYVRDAGVDASVLAAASAISECAAPGRACAAVPGVSEDQLKISVGCAAAAGVMAGAAARTGGKRFNFPFVLLFSPIWSIFLISFGFGPVLARLQGVAHPETAAVTCAFAGVAVAFWLWVPIGIGPPPDEPDKI